MHKRGGYLKCHRLLHIGNFWLKGMVGNCGSFVSFEKINFLYNDVLKPFKRLIKERR